MNMNDKQILDMLEKELKNEVEKVNVPLRLQKESIVKMLENAEKDFSVKTGNTAKSGGEAKIAAFSNGNETDCTPIPASDSTAVRSKTVKFNLPRKMMAIAAMVAIVLSVTLVMREDRDYGYVKANTFHEEHKAESPVKGVQSIEDIKMIVADIRKESKPKKENPTVAQTTQMQQPVDKEEVITTAVRAETVTEQEKSIIEGISGYISSAKLEELIAEKEDETVGTITPKEPEGVATYGDFKADIVKNDGEYLYIVSNGVNKETGDTVEKIHIVKASGDSSIEPVSVITLFEGSDEVSFDKCIEIYLKDNMLTAIMNRHEYSFDENGAFYDNSSIVAVYYDTTDPYAPVKVREHVQDGEYISSSLYENKLCLITKKSVVDGSQENPEDVVIPSFSVNGEKATLDFEDIIPVYAPEESYLFITVTDITDFTRGVGRIAFLGVDNNVYCTPSAIVAAREFCSEELDKNGNRSTFTEVHKINIVGSVLSYAGWHRLEGSVVGGFSIDEESGNLRALTTDSSENRLFVLDKEMEFVVRLDIFNGEKVTRVSYIGDNCYVMVEGEEGEKTVIIDLSDPSLPKVAGQIPEKAFSDELYEVSDTMILGIKDLWIDVIKEETGEDHVLMPMSMTLFDVSDPANPKAVSTYSFDESAKSVAATDSRSVMIDAEKKIFGIPVLEIDRETGSQISSYAVFDVSGGEIVCIGNYEHSRIGDVAERSICIENTLYTVSGDRIVAFNLSSSALENNKLTEFSLN